MDRVDIAKGLLLKELNCSMDTLDDRIIIQKKFYMLQEMGIDFGYSFIWNVYGPYSSGLTTYIYKLYDFKDEEALNSCRLTGDSREKCRVINELANDEKLGLSARPLYELLGSLLFWKKNANIDESVTDICKKVNKYKPQFPMDICKVGYQLLEEKGIIVNG